MTFSTLVLIFLSIYLSGALLTRIVYTTILGYGEDYLSYSKQEELNVATGLWPIALLYVICQSISKIFKTFDKFFWQLGYKFKLRLDKRR